VLKRDLSAYYEYSAWLVDKLFDIFPVQEVLRLLYTWLLHTFSFPLPYVAKVLSLQMSFSHRLLSTWRHRQSHVPSRFVPTRSSAFRPPPTSPNPILPHVTPGTVWHAWLAPLDTLWDAVGCSKNSVQAVPPGWTRPLVCMWLLGSSTGGTFLSL
jgi:hypothetical protein